MTGKIRDAPVNQHLHPNFLSVIDLTLLHPSLNESQTHEQLTHHW